MHSCNKHNRGQTLRVYCDRHSVTTTANKCDHAVFLWWYSMFVGRDFYSAQEMTQSQHVMSLDET